MNIRNDIVSRLKIIYLLVAFVAVVITIRIFQLQFLPNENVVDNISSFDTLSVYPRRGDILATNGEVLATAQFVYELRLDLLSKGLRTDTFNTYVSALADSLSKVFPDKTKEQYLEMLRTTRAGTNKFKLLKLNVSTDEYRRIKKFPIFRLGPIKGGFIAIKKETRTLPYQKLGSRTIGGLKFGKYIGIEGYYNTHLQGEKETRIVKRISNRLVQIEDDDDSNIDFALRSGEDIVSTIDIDLQDFIHETLEKQMISLNADTASAVVMEVKTGEIKAIVNLSKRQNGKYLEKNNFAVAGAIEPGSTFKLASLMAGLEDGYFDITDSVNTGRGYKKIGKFQITEASGHGYGKISVKQVLEKSSNVGTAMLISKAYGNRPEEFIKRLYAMNLSKKVNIEVHGEALPNIKSPDNEMWSPVSLPQMSIGYELLLTPLQMLTFYNAVANNGKMVKPGLIKAIKHYGEIVEEFQPEVLKQSICSHTTLKKAKLMLEGVVERGTAKNIRTKRYKIAGKTGTAQVALGKSGYHRADSQVVAHYGSFAGYFPADKPEYSCIVVIKTKNKHKFYGGTIAAPVFRKIADRIYDTSPKFRKKILKKTTNKDVPYSKVGNINDFNIVYGKLRIPVKGRNKIKSAWVLTNETDKLVEYKNRIIRSDKIPKLTGMGLKDAVYLAESLGLKVIVKGRGTIRQQSLRAGDRLTKGRSIILTLR